MYRIWPPFTLSCGCPLIVTATARGATFVTLNSNGWSVPHSVTSSPSSRVSPVRMTAWNFSLSEALSRSFSRPSSSFMAILTLVSSSVTSMPRRQSPSSSRSAAAHTARLEAFAFCGIRKR